MPRKETPATKFLRELKDFLRYNNDLWGLLAKTGVFLPPVAALLKVIPVASIQRGGVLVFFLPSVFIAFAVVATIFSSLAAIMARATSCDLPRRNAWLSFSMGLTSLLSYVVIYSAMNRFYVAWHCQTDEPCFWLSEILLLITYVAGFALMNTAFMLLALTGFRGNK